MKKAQFSYILAVAVWSMAIYIASSMSSQATSAAPFAFTETQPDGSEIHLHLDGDEHFHQLEDTDGYTVLKDRSWFVYAKKHKNGHLVPTEHRVGKANPKKHGLKKKLKPSKEAREKHRKAIDGIQMIDGTAGDGPSQVPAVSGTLKNLVVLLRFSNHASRTLPSSSDIDILMNAPGGHPTLAPTGSVRDCYLENSYGLLSLDSTVLYWVTLPNTEAYYANGNSGLTTKTHEALKYALDTIDADPSINISDFDQDNDNKIDAITFIHSGYGAEWGGTSSDGASYTNRIWSHKWAISGAWYSTEGVRVYNYHINPGLWSTSGSDIGRIGVICHETGHFLGLPDLYDGNDSDGDGRVGNGIGSYGLMANSWGFDGSQLYPPHMSAYSKSTLGWISPTVIDSAGTFTLAQSQTSGQAYRINLGYETGEYLLIENRQPTGFDSAMPQGGLCIYHIDSAAGNTLEGYPGQSGWPANGNHYKVALLQADGAYDLERGLDRGDRWDVYHAGYVSEIGPATTPNTDGYRGGNITVTNNRIFNISASGSSMSFNFEVVGSEPEVATPPTAPSNLLAGASSSSQIELVWSDNSNDETSFRIQRSSAGSPFAEIASVGSNTTAYSDTSLAASITYSYRIIAENSAGQSSPSNTASATTDAPPPPPTAPADIAAEATSDSSIAISWTDTANNEDGFYVERSLDQVIWENQIATLPANASSYTDTGLSAGTTHYYRVCAFNAQGIAISAVASATSDDPPPHEDAVASSDISVSGTVAGNHTDTHEGAEGREQVITELESNGKTSRRRSYLDHRWQFPNIRGGAAVTLFVDAWAPANNENDNFEFEFSTDGGSSWSSFAPALVINNGTSAGNMRAAAFPTGTKGNIELRVIDTDSTRGNRNKDTVRIDQLLIRTDIDANDFPPAIPDSVFATVRSATAIDLTWRDNSVNEHGFFVHRSTDGSNWQQIGTTSANATSFTDNNATGGNTYQFRVSAFTSSFEAFSQASNEVSTPASPLNLDGLTGGKRKGAIYVDLSWSGASALGTVEIWRSVNGGSFTKVTSTSNDGSQRDQTGLKGGLTLTYQLRSTDGSTTSSTRSISF